MHRSSSLAAFALALLAAGSLPAQETSVTPFHARQWGADFSIGSGFSHIGFLRFRDARRAWVLDIGGGLGNTNQKDSASSLEVKISTFSGSIRLGGRRYRTLGSRAYAVTTLGISGSYLHNSSTQVGFGSTSVNTWSAGLFAEVAGEWMVTAHLGLGASWGVSAVYDHSVARGPATSKATIHGIGLNLGNLGLRGAFYF